MVVQMDRETASAALARRLQPCALGFIDIVSELHHFALINYALPKERLEPHIPARFEILELPIGGERRALLSVVPFVDVDFHFVRLPWLRFRFAQTNHRVYVRDRRTGEHVAWFFGTTLGSRWVHVAQLLWRIPWHHARYRIDCDFDEHARRYRRFVYQIDSAWCAGRVDLEDTGEPAPLVDGFVTREEMTLVLTHPVEGYFHRRDGRVGTYSVSHQVIPMNLARPRDLYFSMYERLGILSADEMQRPASVLVSPRTTFAIHMPPRVVGDLGR
jgi:hypothetical protein